MPDYIKLSLSRLFLLAVAVVIVSAFCISTASAVTGVFSGVTSYIIPDKYCKDKPENTDIILVFDGEPDATSSGLFYGKGTMSAEFKRAAPSQYDVTYSNSKYEKMPDSKMELLPFEDGFRAIIKDHIPEQKELREGTCFYERFEVVLKPTKDSVESIKTRAKELFTAEVLSKDAEYQLNTKMDYWGAIAKANKALEILEPIYGKYSEGTVKTSFLLIFSLYSLHRYDEALAILEPYKNKFPEIKDFKDIEDLFQKQLEEQNELFRSDPESNRDISFDTLG